MAMIYKKAGKGQSKAVVLEDENGGSPTGTPTAGGKGGLSFGSAKAKGLGRMSRAIVPTDAPAGSMMRFGGGMSTNVMSPSMIEAMADFSIFEEVGQQRFDTSLNGPDAVENTSGGVSGGSEAVPPFTGGGGGGGGREGVPLPGSAGGGGGDDSGYDAEMGVGGGGMGANNKVVPLSPPREKRKPFQSASTKTRVADFRKKLSAPQKSCVPVVTPKNKFFNVWDPVLIVCLIFTAIVTPVEVAFLRQPEWPFDGLFYVNRVVDFCFVVDMILQFNLAFNSSAHANNIIIDRWKIAKRYARGSFIIDFISILPYDSLPGGVSDLKALRMARLLKLFKLLRVLRAGRIFKRLETSVVVHYGYMKLGKFFFMVIFSAHLMACAFRLVVGIEDNVESNWILNYFGDENYAKYDDPPWASLYLTAYYWSIMTMTTIGYGDVLPVTTSEVICTTICMMIGTSIYAYIFGNICSILDGMTMRSQTFYNTMDQLNTFMESRYLPEELRVRLREFYRYKFEHQGLEDWHSLVSDMSPLLQGEVAVQINGSWLQSIPLLSNCEEKMYTQISLAMASVAYCPLENVIDLHEPPSAMYIVERGIIGGMSRIFTSGTCLGQDCLWQPLDSPRPYAASTLSYATLLSLQRNDIMEVVAFFPEVRLRLARAGARARAQQKVLVYTRAFTHFRTALRQFSWTNPATGETRKGSMMLPREGMEEAMQFVAEYPPERDLYRVDPMFPSALDGVIQACWSKWSTYQGAASKIQSAFRGSKERVNFLAVYKTMITAVKTMQRATRRMLFRKHLAASGKMRRSMGDKGDPNTDMRIRLMQIEEKLEKLSAVVREIDSRGQHESQFMIGMLAEVHAAVHKDSQANKMTMPRRTLGGSHGNQPVKHRRGFKGF